MLGGRWKTSWGSVLHNFRFPWRQHKAVWSVYFLTAKTWNSSGHWWRRRQSLIESLKRERAITGTREQTKTAFLENNPFSCFIKRQSIFHVDLLSLCLVSNYRCIIVSSFTERSCVSVSVSVCLWSFFCLFVCTCISVLPFSRQPQWNSWRHLACTETWSHCMQQLRHQKLKLQLII